MTNFSPLNDKIDIYSATLGALAETNAQTIIARSLLAGANVTLTPNSDGTTTIGSTGGSGGGGDGNLVAGNFSGSVPSNSVGSNGDYAQDVSNGYIYGPKAAGVWPSTPVFKISVDGNMVVGAYSGVAPANTVGLNGDYALDTSTHNLYGPKAAGTWPSTPIPNPNFAASLATNGYEKNNITGLIMQWGYQGTTNGTFNFPITFPNACLIFLPGNTNAQGLDVDNAFGYAISTSQFILATKQSVSGGWSGYPCSWIAIGY